MNPQLLDVDLQTWVIVFILVAAYLVVRFWRPGRGVGLLVTYVISLASIHWLGAAIYLLPWYFHRGGALVAAGMKQSALAIIALALGAEVTTWMMQRRHSREVQPTPIAVDPAVVNLYLATGAVMYAVMIPLAAHISTIGALVSTGSTVAVVGLALKCWNGWRANNSRAVAMWLGVTALLPFVTVATQGFLGYGMAAMATVCAFVVSFYGLRWRTALVWLFVGFLGLSVYVTYMRDRSELRESIRRGSAFGDRASRVRETLTDFEWFSPYDPAHLSRIDDRLNQDFLVGAAVAYLGTGVVPFAHGSTIIEAAFAVVPRALWPDKVAAAGSGDLVSTYTGITFAQDTSVGIGHVMECYVNFGVAGVLGGFFLLGAVLTLIDRSAFRAVSRGDVHRFTLWYLPGLGLLQVGGSFVDATTVAAAGVAVAIILKYVTTHFLGHDSMPTPQPEEPEDFPALPSGPPETWP